MPIDPASASGPCQPPAIGSPTGSDPCDTPHAPHHLSPTSGPLATQYTLERDVRLESLHPSQREQFWRARMIRVSRLGAAIITHARPRVGSLWRLRAIDPNGTPASAPIMVAALEPRGLLYRVRATFVAESALLRSLGVPDEALNAESADARAQPRRGADLPTETLFDRTG